MVGGGVNGTPISRLAHPRKQIGRLAFPWTRRLLSALGDDLRALRMSRSVADSEVGLHSFELHRRGRLRRFHLRIGRDGAAVLLVDVTEALHLNPVAALLVHQALLGADVRQSARILRARFHGVGRTEARLQAGQMYDLVDRLATADGCCTGCGLEQLHWMTPFSATPAAPYKADLALTYGCNNACSHCYNQCRRETTAPGTGSTGAF